MYNINNYLIVMIIKIYISKNVTLDRILVCTYLLEVRFSCTCSKSKRKNIFVKKTVVSCCITFFVTLPYLYTCSFWLSGWNRVKVWEPPLINTLSFLIMPLATVDETLKNFQRSTTPLYTCSNPEAKLIFIFNNAFQNM